MEDYISRKALLEAMGEEPGMWMDTPWEIQENNDWHKYRELIENAPAANVAPVVEAEWVDVWGGKYANPLWKCTACREEAMHDDKPLPRTDYCPNCGARMRKEGDGNV